MNLKPQNFQSMEHGGALSAGACVLDVDASERVACHLCLQVNFVWKV